MVRQSADGHQCQSSVADPIDGIADAGDSHSQTGLSGNMNAGTGSQ